MYESKFYNLKAVPSGWSASEFAAAVERVETMPRADLLEVANGLGLVFSDAPLSTIDSEDIIAALLVDYEKPQLLAAVGVEPDIT